MTELSTREPVVTLAPPRRRPRHAAPTKRGAIGAAIGWSVAAFVVTRGAFVLLASLVPLQPGQAALGWFQRLVGAADAGWYLSIAQGGYTHLSYAAVHGQENWVFFPLFPVASRVAADVLGAPVFWVGLVVANASFLGFLVVLYRWVARDWSEQRARVAVALASVVPVGTYFVEFRAGPVFLLLSTLCLERLVHRRMAQAALFGALATLCRPTGVVLALPYLVACLSLLAHRPNRARGVRATLLAPAFATGVVVMAAVSHADTGNSLAFLQVQQWWGRAFRAPLTPFVAFFRHPTWLSDWGWSSPPLALVATVLGLAGAAYLWRRGAPAELAVYLVAVVLAGTASTVLLGYTRFVAEAVPLYIAGAVTPRRVGVGLVVISAVAMIAYAVGWLLGVHWTMA